MKLYTAEYDAERPSSKCVEAPLDSKFGVAVGVRYGGEDVKIRPGEILLNGVSASDALGDKYAVFALSTDGEPGYDAYDVATPTDGMTLVDGAAYAETPILPSPATTTLTCDLSRLAGKEWGKPVLATEEEMLLAPFNLRVYDSEGEMQVNGSPDIYIFLDDDGTPGASAGDTPYWRIKYKENWGQYRVSWQKANDAHTAWVNTDEPLVIPENAYAQATYTFAAVTGTGKIVFDIQHHKALKRQFKLYVKKADKGEVEGYGDKYVFDETVSLSGEFEDGEAFGYKVPVAK